MKKNWLSVLSLILALAALVLGLICILQTRRLDSLEAKMDDVLAELARREDLIEILISSESGETPTAPAEELINPSCNLVVLGWTADETVLSIDIFAQTFLPSGMLPESVQLHMVCGDEVQIQEITLLPCGDGCFETELSGVTFSIPYLAEGDAMGLELHATYGGGQIVSNYSAGWYLEEGVLSMVSG